MNYLFHNNEELDHFYSFYSLPINDLFKELQEVTRMNNLSLFHSDTKDSADLFQFERDSLEQYFL